MYNDELVTSLLQREGVYPPDEPTIPAGLSLKLEKDRLFLSGTAGDLIDLADLLVSLALSGENRGQHWHIDDISLMDHASEIPELILFRK